MKTDPQLAVNGGFPVREGSLPKPKRFADNELPYLRQVLEQNTLFCGFGDYVARANQTMINYTGMPYCVAASSGTAAVHLGLIAAGIGPGDEVICTPNTDHGSIAGIIAEGAVPIFCDCADTLQPTADTVAACITEHTAAVIVVHLAGYPAPVDEIVARCELRGIPVIEDCAQAWGTRLHNQVVGSFATAGCFSTNDYKHLSSGDGGFVVLRDEELYRRVANYADKCYDRLFDGSRRQANQGLNYRMTELQGAVALAQMEKLETIIGNYHCIGTRLEEMLAGLPGGRMLPAVADAYCTYKWTALLVSDDLADQRDWIVSALKAEGVPAASYGKYNLIQKPLLKERIVRPWLDDDRKYFPFKQPDGRDYHYRIEDTPNHRRLLNIGIQLMVSPAYADADVDAIAAGIQKVFSAAGNPKQGNLKL